MGFLGFGKKKKVLDLTENYKRQVQRAEQERSLQNKSPVSSGAGPFSFFDSQSADSSSESLTGSGELSSMEEKKKKLAARILEMTGKMEDLSNQIYHLQQRLEVLERKNDIRRV